MKHFFLLFFPKKLILINLARQSHKEFNKKKTEFFSWNKSQANTQIWKPIRKCLPILDNRQFGYICIRIELNKFALSSSAHIYNFLLPTHPYFSFDWKWHCIFACILEQNLICMFKFIFQSEKSDNLRHPHSHIS